jgi:hypothetical protein
MANEIVRRIQNSEKDALSFMAVEDLELLWKLEGKYGEHSKAKISEYYGGFYAKKAEGRTKKSHSKNELVYDMKTHKMVLKGSLEKEPLTFDKAGSLAIHFSAQRKTAVGIDWIKSEKSFKDILTLTNKRSLHQFKMAATMDEEIKKKLNSQTM